MYQLCNSLNAVQLRSPPSPPIISKKFAIRKNLKFYRLNQQRKQVSTVGPVYALTSQSPSDNPNQTQNFKHNQQSSFESGKSGSKSDDEEDENPEDQQQEQNGPFTRARKLFQFIILNISKLFQGFLKVLKVIFPFANGQNRSFIMLMSFAFGVWFILSTDVNSGKNSRYPREVAYSTFVNHVKSRQVKTVRIEENTQRVHFTVIPKIENQNIPLENQQTETSKSISPISNRFQSGQNINTEQQQQAASNQNVQLQSFYTRRIANDQSLVPFLVEHSVDFGVLRATFGSTLNRIVGTTLALWLPLLPFFFIMQRFLEGRMGKRKGGKQGSGAPKPPPVTFADVAGVDTAVAELQEVVTCLKDPTRYQKMRASMPSGVLLCGPPGTGKTLLAKAVAGEANVAFYAASASEFVEMFVGRGAARIRELFAEARKRAPAVVFIDELDAVGSRRGIGFNDERDQTLNQLLTELDGFEGRTGVLLLAATNRQDVLDPALLRPGRISRKITVPLPNENGRKEILQVHMRDIPCQGGDQEKSNMCSYIAQVSYGFSGADLANVVNEAALLAVRRDSEFLQVADLLEGVKRTRFGVNGRSIDITQGFQGFLQRLFGGDGQRVGQMTYGS
eukprot:TRINITY_DN5926_c0_g1_i2.p1 TRINITY_DN5926_c0_g1~~TRINITY_DN5926_c0_g1_i2.p1  ORF type:complete len:620 (-),score=110.12 TRINITY_DN5926_c0_g1_i2:1577-3436(-)